MDRRGFICSMFIFVEFVKDTMFNAPRFITLEQTKQINETEVCDQ